MPHLVPEVEPRRLSYEFKVLKLLFPDLFDPENDILPNIWFDRSNMPQQVNGQEDNQQVEQQVRPNAPERPSAEFTIRPNVRLSEAQESEIRRHFCRLWSVIEFISDINQLLEEDLDR